jgi:hypothetical protein
LWTEYLDGTIVRFRFSGGAVRDVDLQAVLSSEELERPCRQRGWSPRCAPR